MKAYAVEVSGCATIESITEFPSIKSAVNELTNVWGFSKYPSKHGSRNYGGWLRTAEGPKLVYFDVFSAKEWDKVKHAYHK